MAIIFDLPHCTPLKDSDNNDIELISESNPLDILIDVCQYHLLSHALESTNMSRSKKQFVSKTLIMYMISALLFLTFVELHIHTQGAAAMESHGYAVSITTPASDLINDVTYNEISINPDSILKIKQTSDSMLSVFMFIAVLITVLCRTFIGRLRETNKQLPVIAFHGTPPLRAPPL